VAVTQSEKEFRSLLFFGGHTGEFKLEGIETWADSRKIPINWVLNILKYILWATTSTEFFYVEFITGIISEVSVLASVIDNFLSLPSELLLTAVETWRCKVNVKQYYSTVADTGGRAV